MFRKLYLVSDGVRDRDKNSVTKILMQVAVLRDNTYQLIRNIWNDVQEDWPFYTEQERQLLKRSVSHLYSLYHTCTIGSCNIYRTNLNLICKVSRHAL
jgi:hypothetical protein